MGELVRKRREELDISQSELAEKSGVCRQTISAIENNRSRSTSSRVLLSIAKALDTTVQDLFFAENV